MVLIFGTITRVWSLVFFIQLDLHVISRLPHDSRTSSLSLNLQCILLIYSRLQTIPVKEELLEVNWTLPTPGMAITRLSDKNPLIDNQEVTFWPRQSLSSHMYCTKQTSDNVK